MVHGVVSTIDQFRIRYVHVCITLSLLVLTRQLEKYCRDQPRFLWTLSGLSTSTNLHLGSVALLGTEISRMRKKWVQRTYTPDRYAVYS